MLNYDRRRNEVAMVNIKRNCSGISLKFGKVNFVCLCILYIVYIMYTYVFISSHNNMSHDHLNAKVSNFYSSVFIWRKQKTYAIFKQHWEEENPGLSQFEPQQTHSCQSVEILTKLLEFENEFTTDTECLTNS